MTWQQGTPGSSSVTSPGLGGTETQQHREGRLARTIESQTARVPSDVFLWAATGSILGSLACQAFGLKHAALFVGQWAPTFLILGVYNKLVKQLGHDRLEGGRGAAL